MSQLMNSSSAITRTPEVIAIEINNIKEQTRKMVMFNSIEIGRRLVEAKEMLSHGEWGNWLQERVDYSQRTANNLMKIFQEYGSDQLTLLGDNLKSQTFANLSYSQAVALFGVSEEERENFIQENKAEEKSTRELEKLIKEKQKLQEQVNAAKKEKDLILKQTAELIDDKDVEIENFSLEVNRLTKKLEKASADGSKLEAEILRGELQKVNDERSSMIEAVEELRRQLNEKPVEVNASIPEDVEKELQRLRKSETTGNLKFIFEQLGRDFKELLKVIADTEDPKQKEKYKDAFLRLSADMAKKLV